MSFSEKSTPFNSQASLDLNKIAAIIFRKSYLIIGTIAISLIIASLFIRYAKPLYLASVTLKMEDEKSNQLNDLFKFGRVSGKLDNLLKTESEILKSRTYALKTLQKLGYSISYNIEGKILSTELYPNNLFRIVPLLIDSHIIGRSYTITFLSVDRFEISDSKRQKKIYTFSDTIYLDRCILKLEELNPFIIRSYIGRPIQFIFNDLLGRAISLSGSLDVIVQKGTSILEISLTSSDPEFATDYVNTVCRVYIDEVVNIKSQAAQQTIDFIEEQLTLLSSKVKISENDMTLFKQQNKGIELEEIGTLELNRLTTYEVDRNVLLIKQDVLNKLEKNIIDAKDRTVSLISVDKEEAENIPDLLLILNNLIMERISMNENYTPASPTMMENEKKIKAVKTALLKNVQSLREKNKAYLALNQKHIDEASAQLNMLPPKQRLLIDIQREFKVNEKVFQYLLERRLETLINKSSITANASMIDYALVPSGPIYPVPRKTYTIAFLIGLIIGTGFIFINRVFYNKVPDKETIESLSKTPVIGVIKKVANADNETDYDVHVFKSPKSIFSESIRGIRTNINFILKGGKHKAICITSTVSGEGKTFCTINLAASLTMLNYKVIIVGCDLRRPKLHLSFKEISNDIGLSTYLIGKHSLEEVIHKTEYERLDILPAGPPPPNPSELLQTAEMNTLFNHLRETYDFVLYDTAPVGLVSDSFQLMKQSDVNLFIIRAQYSKRDFSIVPDRLAAENGINDIYTILNSYDSSSINYSSLYKSEYGGYYGGGGHYYYGGYNSASYGYYGRKYYSSYNSGYYSDEEPEKPWWMFWAKKTRKKK